MAKTPKKVSDLYIRETNKDFLKAEYISVPNTQIQNRALMVDLSKDLGVRFGVNRIQTQQIFPITSESGPNGESVYGVVNDKFNQVRFAGPDWQNLNDSSGVRPRLGSATGNNFIEITFFGTGLNILTFYNNANRDFRASVDGGAEGSNIIPAGLATVLEGRNYAQNTVINAASGLTLGLHTVKLRAVSGEEALFGFETLNESADLSINQGNYFNDGKLLRLIADTTSAYNSGFENQYGTAGTKGGNVVVYLNDKGQVKKDVQWTDVSPAYLALADHSNEEIIAKHNFREFGAGRADDFSTITNSTSDRAFTLDDGTTTLVCDDVVAVNEGLHPSLIDDFITLTFVGTGLDVFCGRRDGTVPTSDQEVFIDGVSIGLNTFGNGSSSDVLFKICSGLPYGTHTVRIRRNTSAGATQYFRDFIIYGPKKPVIEDSSQELADYNIMADYVALVANGLEKIATGVVKKVNSREMVFSGGGWVVTGVQPNISTSGITISTNITTNYVEYTFFGTGFEMRGYRDTNLSTNTTMLLNGVAVNLANFPSIATSAYGWTYTHSTGVINQNGAFITGCGVSVSGLPLNTYTVRFTHNAGTFMVFEGLDIITPIHSPKLNGPFVLQNTLRVGSQGVGDSRKLAGENSNFLVKAEGITLSPSITSTVFVPMLDMSVVYESKGEYVSITGCATMSISVTGNYPAHTFVVDGKHVGNSVGNLESVAGYYKSISNEHVMYLAPGVHHIQMFWRATSGTAISEIIENNGVNRSGRWLTVKKINN